MATSFTWIATTSVLGSHYRNSVIFAMRVFFRRQLCTNVFFSFVKIVPVEHIDSICVFTNMV